MALSGLFRGAGGLPEPPQHLAHQVEEDVALNVVVVHQVDEVVGVLDVLDEVVGGGPAGVEGGPACLPQHEGFLL